MNNDSHYGSGPKLTEVQKTDGLCNIYYMNDTVHFARTCRTSYVIDDHDERGIDYRDINKLITQY